MVRVKKYAKVSMLWILIGILASAQSVWGASFGAENPIVQIAKSASPAVVNIDVETAPRRSSMPAPFRNDPLFRRFFGEEFEKFSRSVPMKGRGSGFIVSEEGQILTNNHVVDGADKITVTLSNGKTYDAKVLGKDPTFDLAIIKIERDVNLTVLELGDSDTIEVGEWVVAIGNPFGLEHTVTVGVISAKNRSIHAADVNFEGFLQTDAAINPGNSGGPLIDMDGKVVGINTAIIPYAQGLGFAIPVNMAKQIMGDLVEYGKVRRGQLGVVVQNLTKAFAEAYDIKAETGVVVGDVMEDSAAERAGLERGDVIVFANGETVKDVQGFVGKVRSLVPGATLRLEVVRGGKSINITAKLDELSDFENKRPSSQTGGNILEKVGIAASKLTAELKRQYKIKGETGLVVKGIARNSPAQAAGIREGDLILEVNGKKVSDLSSLNSLTQSNKSSVFLLERQGRTFFTSIEIE
ncbi:protease [Synergistales bacterium]|nr:protease [Synergistales bacterium]